MRPSNPLVSFVVAIFLALLTSPALAEPGAQAANPAQPPAPVRAEDREAFDDWIEQRIHVVAARTGDSTDIVDGEGTDNSKSADEARWELESLGIDVDSFLTALPKNLDFPKMLLVNEFVRLPLDRLHPGRGMRRTLFGSPPACNLLADGSVPHSSFFTNTEIASYTPALLSRQFHEAQPIGPLTIEKVKDSGTSEGLWVKDETGRTFILVFDPPFAPEMTTSAEYIGSTLARIVGYQVPRTTIIRRLAGTGDPRFDGRRAVSTVALENFKGGWLYEPVRHRREIRGYKVFSAWVGNVDATEQNSGRTETKGGCHRHYVLDFGASLGSFTFRPQLARLGWTKLFDPYEQFTQPLYDHGLRRVPWEAPYAIHSAAVGYFSPVLDPDRWQPFYTNLGFLEVTEADSQWMAERIARISVDQIAAVVQLAGYTHPSDAEYVLATLLARREVILKRYLAARQLDSPPIGHR